MTQTRPRKPAITVIRFSRLIARQCSASGSNLPDCVVCDTIANGSAVRVRRRGARGGAIIRFEKAFGPGAGAATVRVLGEVTAGTCIALRLVPGARSRKNLGIFGIFESRRFKMNASTGSPL